MKNFRDNKGQELVEFALILPVMVVILIAIAEMGFMWTLRGTVSDAVKASVQQMQNIAGTDVGTAQGTLTNYIQNYLTNHGVPNASSVNVTLSDPDASDYTTVQVTYSYNPTFTLPNFFGIQLLPDTVTMGSTQVINSAVIRSNNFGAGDTILPSAVNTTSPTTILKPDPILGNEMRKQMAFIVDLPGPVDKIVNWWGHDILPGNAGINVDDGTIWVKTPYHNFGNTDPSQVGWGSTGESYAGLLLANGYTTGIYTDGSSGLNIRSIQLPGSLNIHDGDMGSSLSWCVPASAGGGDCDGDLTGANNLLTESINAVGAGFEILPPVPSPSPIDSVTLPSGDLVADKTFRDATYLDKTYSSLKFYTPKGVHGTKFNPPAEGNDIATHLDDYLAMTIDSDGDGIPNKWDGNPQDADDNKNRILDGFESGDVATFLADTTKTEYDVYGNSVDGKTGNIPTENIATGGAVIVNSSIVTPSTATDGQYDSNSCAACPNGDTACFNANCRNDAPFFLRVVSEYTTNTGERMRVPTTAGSSAYYSTEKYKEPDQNKRIYLVEVLSRDMDGDGTYTPGPGDGSISLSDDDLNDDSINNLADTIPLSDGGNTTRGLMFVEGSVGGAAFPSTLSDPTLGYSLSVPDETSLTTLDPSRKATSTAP
jgi:Flp pilus assembly protein TadG